MSEFIDHALTAARLGLRVFPLRPLSDVPAMEDWGKEATTDEGKILAWWRATPYANYAIATGSGSDLFVIDLDGAEAWDWWRAIDIPADTVVSVRSGNDRTHLYFRPNGVEVQTSTPAPGAQIHGEDSYITGPGSMLMTGSYRGDISNIPTAEFDPNVDLVAGGRHHMLQFFDVIAFLPELTSTGEEFTELLFHEPKVETPANYRAARARVFHEALKAQLTLHQAASLAWRSRAGGDLNRIPNGLEQMWKEVDEAELAGPESVDGISLHNAPTPFILLTDGERSVVAGYEWWGSRYVSWAEKAAPIEAVQYHRLHRWLVLSHAFADLAIIPKRSGALRLHLPSIVIGARSLGLNEGTGPASAILRALLPPDESPGIVFGDVTDLATANRSSQTMHFECRTVEGALAARTWSRETLTQFIWAIDPAVSEVESLLEDQLEDTPTSNFGPTPSKLATELADAKDQLKMVLGQAPYSMLMEQDALDRHSALKLALNGTFPDDHFGRGRASLLDFADSIRKCATLVAMSEGAPQVSLEHELIAIDQAEEWLGSLLWMMEQIENWTGQPSDNRLPRDAEPLLKQKRWLDRVQPVTVP